MSSHNSNNSESRRGSTLAHDVGPSKTPEPKRVRQQTTTSVTVTVGQKIRYSELLWLDRRMKKELRRLQDHHLGFAEAEFGCNYPSDDEDQRSVRMMKRKRDRNPVDSDTEQQDASPKKTPRPKASSGRKEPAAKAAKASA
jgi:hypothetical protein